MGEITRLNWCYCLGGQPPYIQDEKVKQCQIQYLVHWKDFDVSEDTWEPRKHLAHVPELVNDFHQLYPDKPKPWR